MYLIYLILLIQSNFQLRRFELSTLELQVWWVFKKKNSFIIHNQTISTSLTINLNNLANKLHFPLWPPHLLVMNINSLIWFCYLLMDERPLISKKLWIEHQQYTPRSKYTTWLKCTLGNTYELNEKTLLSSLNDKWLEIFIIQHSWFQIFNLFQFVHPWCQAMIMCTFCPGEFKFHFYQLRISQVLKTATFDSKLNQYII